MTVESLDRTISGCRLAEARNTALGLLHATISGRVWMRMCFMGYSDIAGDPYLTWRLAVSAAESLARAAGYKQHAKDTEGIPSGHGISMNNDHGTRPTINIRLAYWLDIPHLAQHRQTRS